MRKILIANRGEIACRIIRSCRELGLATVAVYSDADAKSLHVEAADEAVAIGPPKAAVSYLRLDRILEAAAASGADAVHPGYGFLAENAEFARAVTDAGMVWIGPRPETIDDMGDKERARTLARGAGVPILPGSPRFAPDDLAGSGEAADAIGFPLLVKAAAGGGGIGMRRVDDPAKLEEVVRATQAMAARAFGDGTVYLEKLVTPARHIEIQVFGFGDGRAIHLFERDCSVQRRFQKIVEESPAPGLAPEVRARMAEAAVALARQERYRGAGTIEFVVGPKQNFYFLEMNTRIQVEHPVTEMLTGVDLVAMQIRLARGDDLRGEFDQEAIVPDGHALECRIYAERPEMNFLPSPGTLARFEPPPAAPDLRVDSGFRSGDTVTFHYDPLLAKLIVRAADRTAALARAAEALEGFTVEGVHTNIAFLAKLMRHAPFVRGEVATNYVETHLDALK